MAVTKEWLCFVKKLFLRSVSISHLMQIVFLARGERPCVAPRNAPYVILVIGRDKPYRYAVLSTFGTASGIVAHETGAYASHKRPPLANNRNNHKKMYFFADRYFRLC